MSGLPLGGRRIVVADRASRTSGREVVIPGLRAHPDIAPPPNLWNHEFDMPVSNIGGVTMGTPTTLDSNLTVKSHLYLKGPAAAAHANIGRYWVSPPTPFTVTGKLSGWTGRQGLLSTSHFAGIFVGV